MRSLRTKITAMTVCVLIVFMFLAAVFSVTAIKYVGDRNADQTLSLLCKVGQKNLNHYFESVEQSVEMVSAFVKSDLDGLDDEKLQAHLDRVSSIFHSLTYKTFGVLTYYYRIDPSVSKNVKGFWYVNLDGTEFQEHEVTDITLYDTEDTSNLVWFTVPKFTGKAVWLSPYITDNLDVRVISYNVPVYYDSQFIGVIGIEIDYSTMADEVNNITLYKNGYAFLNDAEGTLLYHPRMDVTTMETLPKVPDGILGDAHQFRYNFEGIEKQCVCLPLINGFRLNVSVPVQEINSLWMKWNCVILIGFCGILTGFIIFIMRYTRTITKPLKDLTVVAEQIGEGNYDQKLDYDGNDEIGVLTRTFNRVSKKLKTNISELNDLTKRLSLQQESLSALLDNMPAMNFSKDAVTGKFIYCNQGFAEYANKATPADVIGLTDFDIFDTETAGHFVADDLKTLSMDTPYVFYEDVHDAAGNPRQFRTTKMKFHNSSGQQCLLGMCMDVTELERIRREIEQTQEEKKSYMRLNALNGNLILLYFVDPQTGHYTEYRSGGKNGALDIGRQGTDFFKMVYEDGLNKVHPDDKAMFHAQFTQKNIIDTIHNNDVFMVEFRLLYGETPSYVMLRAAEIDEGGTTMLIIGLFDENARIRQEQEYARNLTTARQLATIDSLTGIKNKHAYVQWEEKINEKINNGGQEPFAVVVCDVNNLKAVNDLYGHKEGDACIKKACMTICKTFSHSPVFRIGGDEFVVLLSGDDYIRRASLMEQINAVPRNRSQIRIGETISAGMVEYNEYKHYSLLSVFEEADKAMYARKQALKASLAAMDQNSEPDQDSEEPPVIKIRKKILIAEDMEMDRQMMADCLQEEYDIFVASDGIEALDVLRSHKEEIDLVLLNLQMPNKNGREVIAEMQVDEDLMSIPVIILTVDQNAELDCLKIGAMDFISKPFQDIEIVKARIAKCIELSEDRKLIRSAERDNLTGLLNSDYFFRYVSRLDNIYKGTAMDALVCDVNHFHSVNKQYGRQFGHNVLRIMGSSMKKTARKTGGIACRQKADTFLLYCPHQDDFETILNEFKSEVYADKEIKERISIRIGLYSNAQQESEVEERYAHAKAAAEKVRDDPDSLCGFYEVS